MKYFLTGLIGIVFIGCSFNTPYFQDNNNSLILKVDNKTINIQTNNQQTYKLGSPLANSVFFEDEKLRIEYIQLKSEYTWTGLADGIYQDFLRKNIKGVEKVNSYRIKNGDIYKFAVNKNYFYLISLYSVDSNLFLLDYNGDITSEVLKTNLVIKQENRLKTKLLKRFLENYQFKGFFEKERSEETIMIPSH